MQSFLENKILPFFGKLLKISVLFLIKAFLIKQYVHSYLVYVCDKNCLRYHDNYCHVAKMSFIRLHIYFVLETFFLELVSEQWRFDLGPLNLVKSNIPVLHSLQEDGCQKSIKKWIFDDPSHINRLGQVILVTGLMETSSSVSFLMK